MKAAVVFDFGGVVFRWQPIELMKQAVPRLATDDDSARALARSFFEGFTPHSDWAAFDLGQVEADGLAQRIARRTGHAEQDVRAVIDAIPPHLQAQAPTVDLMRRLRDAGHPLYYLSNMPRPYADHLESRHDFFAWFDDGLFSARVGLMKPQREMFDLARERFGIDPARSVFIDDHRGNVEAARSYGWQAILFEQAEGCVAALQREGWL